MEDQHLESLEKIRKVWKAIIDKYSNLPEGEQGDVLDLRSGEIIEDSGHLRSMKDSTRQRDNVWKSLFFAEVKEHQIKTKGGSKGALIAPNRIDHGVGGLYNGINSKKLANIAASGRKEAKKDGNSYSEAGKSTKGQYKAAGRTRMGTEISFLESGVDNRCARHKDGTIESIPILTDSEEEAREEQYYDELLLEDPNYFHSTRRLQITTRSTVSETDNLTVLPGKGASSKTYYMTSRARIKEGTPAKAVPRPGAGDPSMEEDPLVFQKPRYVPAECPGMHSSSPLCSVNPNAINVCILTASRVRRMRAAIRRSNMKSGNFRLKRLVWNYFVHCKRRKRHLAGKNALNS
ncbi:hypothetical protein BRETT_005191 [Brettanomyces bruxellensis]|uniref:Uncharacterized protein n=1 Tax=Dekkera bruxellensis TaxID=5007 RepID=A0A871R675_DEKBR|nr:uncharacterized protein BRETT_005191 [Brettanomyces bruxellensis]QOU18131.1 hypothetical protein BRETT_005191 [Brettanomyces bruxellensis]